ncbi:MAG: hypothetical protein KDK07_03015 [Bauldia sp.]|nr:hypothetical protein [Bauldia sp.]
MMLSVREPARPRDEYLRLRRAFEPDRIRLVIVGESPPVSGLYFYDPEGLVSEPLFSALMKRIGFIPSTKAEGLAELRRRGWLLVDATYQSVNPLSAKERDAVIEADYPLLRDDLRNLLGEHSDTPLVVIKANVCRLVEPRLVRDGFTVLNRGRVVFFPSHGQQGRFHQQFEALVGPAPPVDGPAPSR